MKRLVITILSTLSLAIAARGGDADKVPAPYQPGEELRYSVKWKFFRLGTIILRTEQDTAAPEPGMVKLTMIVESNPDLSFICIRELNESHVRPTVGFTDDFHARHQQGDEILEARQHFDPTTGTALYTLTDAEKGTVVQNDTLLNVSPFVDGAALLFKARVLSRSTGLIHLPTMIKGKIMNTTLDYRGDTERVSIDACDREIRTRRFTGQADWTGGTAGMSGEFAGWMSDDDAAIPIRAEMKILLGSIDLELEQWTRPGWVPPSGTLMASAERDGR